MTTDSWNHHTINSKMRRRIISLTLVACFALSLLSFTPSTATAKPISHNNNNNNNQALNSASQASTKNRHHYQQAQNNHGGLLNRLSSSWTSLTTPLQGLHAISGSPGPASVSHSGAGVKRLHKRAVDMKKPTTATAATSGGKKGGAQLKKVDKSTARAKHTYAAYEAIVNSDSQMPVFLNQHHPMTTNMGSNSGMRKGKPTSLTTPVAAGGEKKKKAGAVTPIDILRQTGTKRPTAAAAASPITPSAEEEDAKEEERKRKAKAEMEGTSPARKTEAETEGMTPAKDPHHPIKNNNNNTNRLSTASRAAVAAAMEDGISTVKTLFDNVFAQEEQQPSRRNVVESATGTAFEGEGENSEDIEAIKETINAAAHAVVAAAAAAVAGNSQHDTSPSGHHLEERDATGILKQALEDIAHKIEQAATAAIALGIPSLTDHTLDSHSSAASHEGEALEGERLAPVFENHQDAIVDDEGAVDLLAIANNNNNNYHDTTPASTTGEEFSSTITKQKPGPIFINDNEYISHSSFESSDTTTTDEWHLIDNNDDDFDYMSQYIHRQPDNFPGSESILFTGTVLQRTLASSFLLLSGFLMLVGLISYKMYARRKTTSPWAFLHYMTFGVFGSLFYDSAYLSNSTLNSYTTTSQASPSSTMKRSFGSGPTSTTTWFRRSSLTRSTTSSSTGHSHHIMSTPAEKEPLLPEPVIASSSSSSSSASSLFNKGGGASRSELRRTSTAQHHQMQIELALQQQQRREEEQQQQQAEMDYLQRSFMRRTSI